MYQINQLLQKELIIFFISEEEYPFLKYFTFSNYPIKEQFEINFEKIINKNNYPVIKSFIKYYYEGDEEKIQIYL